ncbi:MAG: DUF2796 domain-containing protein [Pseudomonadota bacterium]|nr:DUF2796 domain-containing protein [Pseudomonadota bacterium]
MQLNSFVRDKIFFIFFLIFLIAIANSLDASETAHEHGVGQLYIAIEGHDVEIELTIPGSDVVGFEHRPSTEDQRKAVITGVKTLRNVNKIVNLNTVAKCHIEDVKVTSGLLEDQKDDIGHSGNHNHKHKHETKNSVDHKEVHSEFIAHYHFHCEHPKLLSTVQLGFFKVFPSAHELEAKWITPKGQGASELTPSSPNLNF